MRTSTLIFLVSLTFTVLTVVSAQGTGRVCRQGGAPPAECSAEGQYEWDNKACKWICKGCRSNEGKFVPIGEKYYNECNSCTCGENGSSLCTKIGCPTGVCWNDQGKQTACRPVQCLINPCENADREGACPMAFCTPDYSTGCNFKCSKPNMCIQGGAPPAECSAEGQYQWDNIACKWICKRPVQCLVNPCENADREGACPMAFCTPDYSVGCNFKCSKPDICVQGGAPPAECSAEGQYQWDNKACKWICKNTTPGPIMCIQGGAPPAECSAEGQYQWDNKACKWICKGCRSNEGKFVSIGSKYYNQCNSCTCGENGSLCTKMGCFGVCFDDKGKGYQTGDTMKQSCNNCQCASNGQWGCTKMACEVVVLSATFRVTMTRKSNTVDFVNAAMRGVAKSAGEDVLAAFVISNSDIKPDTATGNYKWLVKIGIKGATDTERKSLLARYVTEAKNTLKAVKTNNINAADENENDASTVAATVDSEADLTTEETMMAMQSCPDGSDISAADQCPIDTLAVPATATATTSSSSSSTPLVAIIVPIVAGVVLIAVIATAVVVLRRRANTIKSINNVQQDTQMAQRV